MTCLSLSRSLLPRSVTPYNANEFRSSPRRHVSNPNLNQPNLGVTSSSSRPLHSLTRWRARVRRYYRTPNFPHLTRHPTTTTATTSVHFASRFVGDHRGGARSGKGSTSCRERRWRARTEILLHNAVLLSCLFVHGHTRSKAQPQGMSSDLTLLRVGTPRESLLGSRKDGLRKRKKLVQIDLDSRNITRWFTSMLRFNYLKKSISLNILSNKGLAVTID